MTAIGPYAPARWAGPTLYVSGQLPLNPATGQIDGATIEAQTRQVLDNIESILKKEGLSWCDVVRVDIFLREIDQHFKAMNVVYAERFEGCELKPVRQTVQAALPKPEALIEISCVAYRVAKNI